MKADKSLKYSVDFLLCALFVFLMLQGITGRALHEIAGVFSVILLAVHLLLNIKGVVSAFKPSCAVKNPRRTAFMLILLLLAAFSLVSGILLSPLLSPVKQFADTEALKTIHSVSSVLFFACVFAHTGRNLPSKSVKKEKNNE